ncbi:hypothetical protein SKAU_G00392200 [Synaphobranchus kaupii]|uniref:Uncharacterized protein n=1 Tax=Synaphobranchus kaupii TaxID=118154 RepID=A0A9Q1IBP9_SYNKA|nr:hypothetical protein SKAU_G00392200 [Synaphobranchus kaupii]
MVPIRRGPGCTVASAPPTPPHPTPPAGPLVRPGSACRAFGSVSAEAGAAADRCGCPGVTVPPWLEERRDHRGAVEGKRGALTVFLGVSRGP